MTVRKIVCLCVCVCVSVYVCVRERERGKERERERERKRKRERKLCCSTEPSDYPYMYMIYINTIYAQMYITYIQYVILGNLKQINLHCLSTGRELLGLPTCCSYDTSTHVAARTFPLSMVYIVRIKYRDWVESIWKFLVM